MQADRLLLALLVSTLYSVPVSADTLTLTNGDTLSGAIKRVAEGTLILDSELLGTVPVPWAAIQTVVSDTRFSILTEDGQLREGILGRKGDRTVVTLAESGVVELPSSSVARVVPSERQKGPFHAFRAADGAVDLGYSVARGNQNQAQSSLGARADYTSAEYEFTGRLDSLFARQDGARSQSRHALRMRVDRFFNSRAFTYGRSGFERNERRNLNLRTNLGGGIGWRMRSSKSTDLSLLGGLAYVHERFRGAENRVSAEGSFGLSWNTRLFDFIDLVTEFSMNPNLSDIGRIRMEYDSTVSVPLAGRFTYSLRVFDRFDSRPVESVRKNDYGIVSGLGLKF